MARNKQDPNVKNGSFVQLGHVCSYCSVQMSQRTKDPFHCVFHFGSKLMHTTIIIETHGSPTPQTDQFRPSYLSPKEGEKLHEKTVYKDLASFLHC